MANNEIDMDYESAFSELDDLVQKIENEELPLEESMALFERGVQLAGHCRTLLDDAERRISQIIDDEGNTAPFDESA